MARLVTLTPSLGVAIPIIKVVSDFCNLRCRYCFYNTRDQLTRTVMSDELLEKFVVEYMELFSGHLFFIWHGGEPLLASLPFFERIVELQREHLKEGTIKLAQILAGSDKEIIVGGDNTLAVMKELNLYDKFSFVSTGGAMLTFLATGTLPGIEALNK